MRERLGSESRRRPLPRTSRKGLWGAFLLPLLSSACTSNDEQEARPEDPHAKARWAMVEEQIVAHGVTDPRVLKAMRAVPRHRFVPDLYQDRAYANHPLPIGHGQTISQPYIVAFMSEALELRPGAKVLEIGTGSGYQAAVLAAMGCRVFSIEIVEPLAHRSAGILRELGYDVEVRTGDGYHGWPEEAPFEAVIVTAAPDHVPQPLVDQLAEGGRMIVPVGDAFQELLLLEKRGDKVERRRVLPVRFVPMTGEARKRDGK